jgi:hypothetical protein
VLLLPIAAQLALGVYLRLHVHERTLRPWAVRAHGLVGRSFPVLGWTQMLFGAIAFRGYCRGGALGQCLAHYIMVREPGHDEIPFHEREGSKEKTWSPYVFFLDGRLG